MTDVQFVVAVALPCFTVLAGLLLNNYRLNDAKEVLRAEARAGKIELKSDFQKLKADIEKLSRKMDEHLSMVLGKIEELERKR